MGTFLWCCGQTNARRSSQQDAEDRNVGLATSIIKFVKRRCMWTTKKKRNRQLHLHLQDKKQHQLKNTNQLVTLEEWILASPSLNLSFAGEGEFQVFKQTSNSNRVHPSFDRTQEGCLAKSREKFSMERSAKLVVEAHRGDVKDSSLCRSKSGKIKKKVSFRLPEVADIFILDSPGGHFENV